MKNNTIISPIAIDMGAKNTGVYYAHYKQGETLAEIDKKGEVLVYDKYTALLKERTANRHTRRGYQRKKLAKRLLKVILKDYFKFDSASHSQAIGFLLNRRGFSYLDKNFSTRHLNNIPQEALNYLPVEVKNKLLKDDSITESLNHLAENPNKLISLFDSIANFDEKKAFMEKEAKIKKNLVYINYLKKIKESCNFRINNPNKTVEEKAKDANKLSETSKWIVEKLISAGVSTLNNTLNTEIKINLLNHINENDCETLLNELSSIPDNIYEEKKKQTQNNKSVWNFNFHKFEFNEKNETGLEENNVRTHLHHLCYAIHQIKNELVSGGRHRSKYFEEIKSDIKSFQNHPHKYLSHFAQAILTNDELDFEKVTNLVCHISNLELKPLRLYFNDKTPIERIKRKNRKNQSRRFLTHNKNNNFQDQFSAKKLSGIVSRWFKKNWRVNKDTDGDKKVAEYKELKALWEEHKNKDDIIQFWLDINPILTIPPYQSMTNRHPPRCYSLLLNENYLNENYPNWKNWLQFLSPNEILKEKLAALRTRRTEKIIDPNSNKIKRLVSDKQILLRQLQLTLDTAKKHDKNHLNEIWSIHHWMLHLKDYKEKINLQDKLSEVIKKSKLPDELKKGMDFDKKGSFAHFINKYYQTRKKAKTGRYFLIQEEKDKWLTSGKLLTLCTHKPRQKKYQWLIDLAAIIGVESNKLKSLIGKKNPENWLKEINGFKRACEQAAKEQKNYRGELKAQISQNSDLQKLETKCKEKAKELTQKIWSNIDEKQVLVKSEKFESIFSFAQINNIIFKDRNGFSNTCSVCSMDNGVRMQEIDGIVKASRLPALKVKLIDGVVMRICDAISRQIATTKWDDIKQELDKGQRVKIPLILEQNHFEFEPSLSKIKKPGTNLKEDDDRGTQYQNKINRVKASAKGHCAYTGSELGENGEIDHIIPQSSKYGTLNDEANLIYVTNYGNQEKGKQIKYLSNLNKKYKKLVFGELIYNDDEEIIQFIYHQLVGEGSVVGKFDDEKEFTFGQYLSFINLTPEQQLAFKHALFLNDSDPLKQRVINSLQNRNRTIVNGTQRYLAQCIADKIHRIARKNKKENLIQFDFFEYNAKVNTANSTYELRKFYQIEKPKHQPLHSHLIDAQMAFLLACENHKNNGSMRIKFDDFETITQELNKQTSEILQTDKYFRISHINESDCKIVKLNRKKSSTGVRIHRSFHRPNFYAEHYLALFFGKDNNEITVKAGFSWENSVAIPNKYKQFILPALKLAKSSIFSDSQFDSISAFYYEFINKFNKLDNDVFYVAWDKKKIHTYLFENFSTYELAKGRNLDNIANLFRALSYQSKKEKIEKFEDIINTINDNNNFTIKIFNNVLQLPVRNEWIKLKNSYKIFNGDFNKFLANYFQKEKNFTDKGSQINAHQKVRKNYSLPIANNLGHFLQKRQSWNGNTICQISPDSDSRQDGNKFSRLVLMNNGELKEVINQAFVSKNTFKLKNERIVTSPDYININPNKWIEININRNNHWFDKVFYKIDNKTRPQVKVILSGEFNNSCIDSLLENPLTKPKETTTIRNKLSNSNFPCTIEYTASGYNREIKAKLLEILI